MRDTEDAAAEHEDATMCNDVPGAASQSAALFHDVTPSVAFTIAQQDKNQRTT